MRWAVAGALFAMVAFAADQAQAGTLEERNVAGWDLTAYSDDGGRFMACYVGAPYQSGISLGFMVFSNFEWEMDLFNADWSLHKGDQFVVALSVDGSAE